MEVIYINKIIDLLCEKINIFSGAQLKIVAMATMLIDHVNKAMIYPNLISNTGALAYLSDFFDIVGRIAFPVFCFMIVEGYFKTKNRLNYLVRLLIIGIISEVPFDMFTTGTFYNGNWNNVIFTLVLVFITIWIIDKLKEKVIAKKIGI